MSGGGNALMESFTSQIHQEIHPYQSFDATTSISQSRAAAVMPNRQNNATFNMTTHSNLNRTRNSSANLDMMMSSTLLTTAKKCSAIIKIE